MFAMVFSPGPANIVLAAAGARQGLRKSAPLIAGIDSVFLLKSCLVGFGLAEVFQRYPIILSSVQWLGVAYLIWLAWGFLNTQANTERSMKNIIGFKEGAILQTLNAKGWLLVTLMFSLFAKPAFELWGNYSTWVLIAMLAALNISLHTVWVIIGATLGYFNNSHTFEKGMNLGFATTLLLTALWIGWTGIQL